MSRYREGDTRGIGDLPKKFLDSVTVRVWSLAHQHLYKRVTVFRALMCAVSENNQLKIIFMPERHIWGGIFYFPRCTLDRIPWGESL